MNKQRDVLTKVLFFFFLTTKAMYIALFIPQETLSILLYLL